MKDPFSLMFEDVGMKITQLDTNSLIAENETWLVAYSPRWRGNDFTGFWEASAVSYFAEDKEEIINGWHNYNASQTIPSGIGVYAFGDAMSTHPLHFHFGGICNHDVVPHECWEFCKRIKEASK